MISPPPEIHIWKEPWPHTLVTMATSLLQSVSFSEQKKKKRRRERERERWEGDGGREREREVGGREREGGRKRQIGRASCRERV